MNQVTVNGLTLSLAGLSRKDTAKNRVAYCIAGTHRDMTAIQFPSHRTMKRLAREYLGCELNEHPRGNNGFFFYLYLEEGTKPEKRAAFLAAVVARSVPVPT